MDGKYIFQIITNHAILQWKFVKISKRCNKESWFPNSDSNQTLRLIIAKKKYKSIAMYLWHIR